MATDTLINELANNWGWIALRGAAAIIFGILAFAWPGITLLVLTLFWGAYALIDGVLALVGAFRMKDRGKPIWPLVLVGVLGIVAGILAFVWPGMTALVLLMFIAAWAIVTGILQIIVAIRIRKAIDNEWLLILSGAVSVIFGALMVWSPGAGAVAVVWVIAAYATFFGILLVALGFRLRGLSKGAAAPT
jgi:uncharacterized membrane protein HdeD (DUF308 family)